MRKKSHILLARYIAKNTEDEELKKHRLSFYIGSILPACKPSYEYKKHEINGTFPEVKKIVNQSIFGKQQGKLTRKRRYYMNLGQVTHYVADYFTYPHNEVFDCIIKDHCIYEKNLNEALKSYIDSEQIYINKSLIDSFRKPEDICRLIKNLHAQYVSGRSTVNNDCIYIVAMCHIIVGGILKLLIENRSYGYINRLRPNVA